MPNIDIYVGCIKLTAYFRTVNFPSDRTSIKWNASSLRDDGELEGNFHFELVNGRDFECDGCSVNSEDFVVARRARTSPSTSSVSLATFSPTTAPLSTSSASSSTAAVAGAQATESEAEEPVAQESSGSNDALKIGLGVGLGVGIPLLLAFAVALFCMRRRRKHRRDSLPRGRQPSPTESTVGMDQWTSQDSHVSQQMLFRNSTTARSEMSSWSHRSWIDPFEFEQAEMRDNDAMSQLRHSIRSSLRSRRSEVSLTDAYWEGRALEDIPESPQPVYDARWSWHAS